MAKTNGFKYSLNGQGKIAAVPNLKQILMKDWHLIEQQPLLKKCIKPCRSCLTIEGSRWKIYRTRQCKLWEKLLKHMLGSCVALSLLLCNVFLVQLKLFELKDKLNRKLQNVLPNNGICDMHMTDFTTKKKLIASAPSNTLCHQVWSQV